APTSPPYILCCDSARDPRHSHSFPTRRSSDLDARNVMKASVASSSLNFTATSPPPITDSGEPCTEGKGNHRASSPTLKSLVSEMMPDTKLPSYTIADSGESANTLDTEVEKSTSSTAPDLPTSFVLENNSPITVRVSITESSVHAMLCVLRRSYFSG